ncbi:MAG: carbohydrate binding domain-containing protein [Bacteroidales bacterium]|nr:carbohydrate binding domain-containing protein [Bacteroidales bacterium]
MRKKLLSTALAVATSLGALAQGSHVMDVNVNKEGAPIQSTMYGIFFEDINFAADGGLYAEMIKNRSFEFPQNFMGWRTFGNVSLRKDGPFNNNPHYARLGYAGHPHKHTGLENEGFFGITIKEGEEYRMSLWARCPEGGKSKLQFQVVDNASMGETQELQSFTITVDGKEWQKYEAKFKGKTSIKKGSIRIFLRPNDSKKINTTDVEHVSLFPTDTWRGRENGMRKDLAQALYDLKPGVFRFPGGCIVEGTDLESRYQWKNSVGPVENRKLNENRWHYTFDFRFYPDYFQSYGLGFFEFFQLCEDFGSEPLPVISCGLACQFQNQNHKEGEPDMEAHCSLDELQPFIDDALDLIEFANGDKSTKWGKVRADMGHPAPFKLKFLGVGNEQWDYQDNPVFTERLRMFTAAIRAKYPDIKLIGTTGPDSEGPAFDMLKPRMKTIGVDLYDEHFYRPEKWFLSQGHRYDKYDRRGPKVFAGEYACHAKDKKYNRFESSIYEAAFMTGMERNADVVHMATFAPLFAHVEGWQWRPDAIWFDNSSSFRTCSYYVQQMFATNKGTNTVPLLIGKKTVAGDNNQDGLFASAVVDNKTNEVIVKVVNTSKKEQFIALNFNGIKGSHNVKTITLHTDNMEAENSLDNPNRITPHNGSMTASGEKTTSLTDNLPAMTFKIYKLQR